MRTFLSCSVILSLLLGFAGCATQVGPGTMVADRFAYNDAVMRSVNEQMLLNLVRMRYRDQPVFLELSSLLTHYKVRTQGVVTGAMSLGGSSTLTTPGAGVTLEVEESPTVSYLPLQGEDFASRLLSPITPATLVLLSQSGWSLERLFLCCIQRANDLENGVTAAGPTPEHVPPFETFHHLAALMRQIQLAGVFRFELDKDGITVLLHLHTGKRDDTKPMIDEMLRLLDVEPVDGTISLIPGIERARRDQVAVLGRSLLSVMFFLSQSVEPPATHIERGLVTQTKHSDGSRFDWNEMTGKVLHIRSTPNEPAEAAVSVRYRGAWFSIADNDLSGKTTFSLLQYLFSLKAGGKGGREPLLTYPVQ